MMDNGKGKLFNKNFIILWHSQLISQFGTQAFSVAMVFWIKHVTGSATLMGTLMMASMIPGVVLGPVGGVIADHYSRKKIIVLCDSICGISLLLFTSMFLFSTDSDGTFLLVALFVVSIVVAICKAFFSPAASAAIPDLVPVSKVPAANSLNQSSTQLAVFLGLGIGGVLFRILGAPVLFLLDGLSYLYAAIVQVFMRVPQEIQQNNAGLKEQLVVLKNSITDGFVYIWQHKGIRRTFIMGGVLNFFFAPVLVVFPFYVEDVLMAKADWYGYLFAGFGGGAIVGYLSASALKVPDKFRGYLIAIAFISIAILNYVLGVIDVPVLALLVVFCCGVLSGYINVSIINQLQLNTKPAMRGRIFGNFTTLTSGIMPIALGLSGIIIDALDKQVTIIFKATGVLMFIITLLVAFHKDILLFFSQGPLAESEDCKVETFENVKETKVLQEEVF